MWEAKALDQCAGLPTLPTRATKPATGTLTRRFFIWSDMLDFIKQKQQEREKIKSSFSCVHAKTTLKRYTCSNGSIQYVMQCDNCHARVGNPISHRKLKYWQKQNAPAFDSDARTEYRDELDYQYQMHREKFNSAAWWTAYTKYLESDEWKSKRARVLIRDEYKCTIKRGCCTKHATEVHHLTYANVGNEPLEDLTSACHNCHEQITDESRRTWRIM